MFAENDVFVKALVLIITFVTQKTKTKTKKKKKNQKNQNYLNEAMAKKNDRQECIC